MDKIAIGADIGGGHISTAAIRLNDAAIVSPETCRLPVDAQDSAENILAAWSEAINTAISHVKKEQIVGIGIAMPGPFDYNNGICLINDPSQRKFLSLYKMNLKKTLAHCLGLPTDTILFKNDAECFLLGEVFGGAGQKSARTIGITLGTGFGSAFVFDGQSEDGNLWCAPFREGVAEDYISTRWFVKRYKELSGQLVGGAKEIAEALPDCPHARTVFDEFGETLAEFILPLIHQHRADTVVVGGTIARAFDLFSTPLKQKAAAINVAIVQNKLGEKAAMMGGASLFRSKAG